MTHPDGPVLITGATGYIGCALACALIKSGRDVHAVVRPSSDTSRLAKICGVENIHCFKDRKRDLAAIIANVSPVTVFHLAATQGADRSDDDIIDGNLNFAMDLVSALALSDTVKLVNVGSYWQFDSNGTYAPNSLYSACKQAAQDILDYQAEAENIPAISVIFYDVYGPGDWRGKLTAHLATAAGGTVLDMSPGEQKLDMVYIDDAISALEKAEQLADKPGHTRYFAGTGSPLSLRAIAETYGQVSGHRLALNWGARPYANGQIFDPCPPNPKVPNWIAKTGLAEGLAKTAEIDLASMKAPQD